MSNHFWRWAEEPWVHVSGSTRPVAALLDAVVADGRRGVEAVGDVGSVSSSMKPVSTAWAAHTPA